MNEQIYKFDIQRCVIRMFKQKNLVCVDAHRQSNVNSSIENQIVGYIVVITQKSIISSRDQGSNKSKLSEKFTTTAIGSSRFVNDETYAV